MQLSSPSIAPALSARGDTDRPTSLSAKQKASPVDTVPFELPEDVVNKRDARQETFLGAVEQEKARIAEQEQFASTVEQASIRQPSVEKSTELTTSALSEHSKEAIDHTQALPKQQKIGTSDAPKNQLPKAVESSVPKAENIAPAAPAKIDILPQNIANKSTLKNSQGIGIQSFVLRSKQLGTPRAENEKNMLSSTIAPAAPRSSQDLGPAVLARSNQSTLEPNNVSAQQAANHSTEDQSSSKKQREQHSSQSEEPRQPASPSIELKQGAEGRVAAFEVKSSNSTPTGHSAAQAEVVSGIMQQIERLRQSGRSTLQVTLPTPDGQELKLYLRVHADRVQVKVGQASEELHDTINQGWSDLTEQAARKGIRLEMPAFSEEAESRIDFA